MAEHNSAYENILRESLKLLSADYEEQLKFLSYPTGGKSPLPVDELALSFDDAFRAPQNVSNKTKQLLDDIDKLLASMSGGQNAALWTTESLKSDAQWQHIRELAKQTLESMNQAS